MSCNHNMKTKKQPSLAYLRRKYNSNEERNYHSENLLLLAKAFGTDEEIALAERQVRNRKDLDAPVWTMPEWASRNINQYYHTHLMAGN